MNLLTLFVLAWTVWWAPGPAYHQTSFACTGYAWSHWLNTAPGPVRHYPGTPLYQEGLVPGEGPKLNLVGNALIHDGIISSQDYTTSTVKAKEWILSGPILVAGQMPGRTYQHAWTCFAYRRSDSSFRCQNSLAPYYFTLSDRQLPGLWFGRRTKRN